jgi:ribonuclease HI
VRVSHDRSQRQTAGGAGPPEGHLTSGQAAERLGISPAQFRRVAPPPATTYENRYRVACGLWTVEAIQALVESEAVRALRAQRRVARAPASTPKTAPPATGSAARSLQPAGDPLPAVDGLRPYRFWVDGACRGNPGPMGIGIVGFREAASGAWSFHGGRGTNQVAELLALQIALRLVADRGGAVVEIRTDSRYVVGLMTLGWTARANGELVGECRRLCRECGAVRFVQVRGHAGDPNNEQADRLAVRATRGQSPPIPAVLDDTGWTAEAESE